MGPPYFAGEMWPTEDSSDYTGRFCLSSVLVGMGGPVADVVSKVPLADEFFDFILECDAFFSSVANVLVISAILAWVFL